MRHGQQFFLGQYNRRSHMLHLTTSRIRLTITQNSLPALLPKADLHCKTIPSNVSSSPSAALHDPPWNNTLMDSAHSVTHTSVKSDPSKVRKHSVGAFGLIAGAAKDSQAEGTH